jgi:hypothetical protein
MDFPGVQPMSDQGSDPVGLQPELPEGLRPGSENREWQQPVEQRDEAGRNRGGDITRSNEIRGLIGLDPKGCGGLGDPEG